MFDKISCNFFVQTFEEIGTLMLELFFMQSIVRNQTNDF